MDARRALLLAICTAGVGAVGGYAVRVRAEGTPTSQALFYRGTVVEATPGAHRLRVALYQGDSTVNPLCTSAEANLDLGLSHGQFRLPLTGGDGDCVQVVHDNQDLWVEVRVDGVPLNPPRTKLGAAPYAIEAAHAVTARTAQELDPTSGVLAQLKALSDRVAALEGQKSSVTMALDAKPGGIPMAGLSGAFASRGGPVALLLSGSAFSPTVAGEVLEIGVKVDGAVVGSLKTYTNERSSHHTFAPRVIVLAELKAGNHQVTLTAPATISTDGNDFFTAAAFEFPR
jgi:hypothetical protein